MNEIKLSASLANAILDYLRDRPFKEVASLILTAEMEIQSQLKQAEKAGQAATQSPPSDTDAAPEALLVPV